MNIKMNGGMEHKTPGHNAVLHKAPKNYKLLMDPFLVKGATKLYRYDGCVPGDANYPPVQCRDPRSQLSRIWNRLEPADLPVPRFKIDKNYVGIPPQLEITIGNLNDNIDKAFLADMMNKIGPYEELTIFYHPLTNRHLGFGRVVFQDVKHSKLCIEKYNGKSVMGQVLDVFHDAFGKKCQEMFENKTMEKKPYQTPTIIKPPIITEEVRPQKIEPALSKRLEETKISEKEPYRYKDVEHHSDSNTRWSDEEREYRHRHRSRSERERDKDRDRDRDRERDRDRDRDRERHREKYSRTTSETTEVAYPTSSQAPDVPYTSAGSLPYDPYYQQGYNYNFGSSATATPGGSNVWWGDWRHPHPHPHPPSHHHSQEAPPPESKTAEPVEPRPPEATADEKEPEPKPPPPKEEPKNVDLDTRIAMLLKGATGGGGLAPPFLALGISSEEEEDDRLPAKIPDIDTHNPPSDDEVSESEDRESIVSFNQKKDFNSEPLSTTPSPFLSREFYLKSLTLTEQKKTVEEERKKLPPMERIGSDISSSEDELLTGEQPRRISQEQRRYFRSRTS